MAKKKKKKTRSAATLHRQVQDSLQALPFVMEQHKKQGNRMKGLVVRFVSAPMLKVMNATLNKTRYRGEAGAKKQQTERMRRHLEQRQAAVKHYQTQMQKQQRRGRQQ
ncbi:MAG TPA: hypothetical protein VFI96_03245 [Longimicrobiaceae bacterium]|nr:hypothetical protein [Longimicrobiaceae bacterium]